MNDSAKAWTPHYPLRGKPGGSTIRRQTTKPDGRAGDPRPSTDHADSVGKGDTGAKTDDRATGTRINGVAEDASPRKKARQEKPTFPEFIELAKRAISTTPSVVGIRSLQKLLKTGVSESHRPYH